FCPLPHRCGSSTPWNSRNGVTPSHTGRLFHWEFHKISILSARGLRWAEGSATHLSCPRLRSSITGDFRQFAPRQLADGVRAEFYSAVQSSLRVLLSTSLFVNSAQVKELPALGNGIMQGGQIEFRDGALEIPPVSLNLPQGV